jgi:hypothetical protein
MNTLLLGLAVRAETDTIGTRELDALVWCAERGVKYKGHNTAYTSYFGANNPLTQVEYTEPPKRTRMVSDGRSHSPHATPVSTSVDAALGILPAWAFPLISWDGDKQRWDCLLTNSLGLSLGYEGHGPYMAQAILAAGLRCKAAQ